MQGLRKPARAKNRPHADDDLGLRPDTLPALNSNCVFRTECFSPYGKRSWRAQRAGFGHFRRDGQLAHAACKDCENLRGRKTARADRRLRADDEAVRTQTTILYNPPRRVPCYAEGRLPSARARAKRAKPLEMHFSIPVTPECDT